MKTALVVVCALFSFGLHGQIVDLPTSASSSTPANDFDSGRYVKKKKTTPKKKARMPASVEDEKTETETASAVQASDAAPPTTPPISTLQDGKETRAIPQPTPTITTEEATFGKSMRDAVIGGDLEQIDKYRSFLDPEDVRKNLFEITLAPSYFYNASSSPYYFRNYLNSSPGAFVGLNMWITPFFGFAHC